MENIIAPSIIHYSVILTNSRSNYTKNFKISIKTFFFLEFGFTATLRGKYRDFSCISCAVPSMHSLPHDQPPPPECY